jgi:carboxymethylenebutenolidase
MGQDVNQIFNGKTISGYLAVPSSGSGKPVIVVQEWWGLVPHIKEIVDRCASQGFIAFAPDLYHGEKTTEPDTAKKLLMELELDGAGAEISNAAQYLLTLPEVKSSTVGVIGFCMGGALAIWSATLSEEISSVVGFYPGKSWDRHKPNWINFKNKRAQIHCSEEDGTSAAPSIQEAKEAILSAGGMVEIFDYPNTRHAFFNNERPEVYDKDSAELSWERTIGFLKALP